MHLLYADESGTMGDANQKHFVLAGFSVFERQSFWIANELDKIVAKFNPADPSAIELHGNPMFGGKGFWRKIPKEDRLQAMKESLSVFVNTHNANKIFGCVVNKMLVSPKDPVEYSFEQLSSRFDYYLRRLHKSNDTQRGLIVFDKSTYESTIQGLATNFRTIGHTWEVLRNLAEVPLFLDSKASRLIQLADLVAYSLFRKYEYGDDQFFSIVENRVDSFGGIQHRLHLKVK